MVEPRFIHCPQCNGFGTELTPGGQSVSCPHCQATTASIMVYDDDMVVWRLRYDAAALRKRKIMALARRAWNGLSVIIGLAGGVALVDILRRFTVTTEPYLTLLTDQSPEHLLFWISVLTDLGLYARVTKQLQSRRTIQRPRRLQSQASAAPIDWPVVEQLVPKFGIDASQYLTLEARQLLEQTLQFAEHHGHTRVTPTHIFWQILDTAPGKAALYRLQLNLEEIKAGCKRVADYAQEHSPAPVGEALLRAYAEARQSQRPQIGLLELMVGSVQTDERLAMLLDEFGVTLKELQHVVHWGNVVITLLTGERRRQRLARSKPKTTMNRALTARPTRLLDSVSQDFTLLARSNHFLPTVGRTAEVSEAFRVLQEGHSSVMLVGDAGVGKSTILEGIAELMSAENVPASLQDKRLVVTDPGALIAGASDIGGLEGRMQNIIYEIIQAGNVIWCIEDIHTLLGAGSTHSSIDIGKILMNYISQGYIKVIGTTTTKEFERYVEPNETFLRRFQIVRIQELEQDAAILVCEGRAPYVEGKYRVFFTYQALADCVRLSERYMPDRHLPAKALDVLEEAAVLAREQAGGKPTLVTKEQVASVIAQKTNVPVASITVSESDRLLHLETILHQRVIGQAEAIIAIAQALRRAREDVRDLTRPIASLLFLGPTGVGKTETAKAIAETYCGSEERMIRFDMSEFQTVESVAKLIGGPGQPGALTEAIRQTPLSIVLLDELEKAHHDILNVFLQVMEDGRLTDGSGYTADFTNAVVIATSNAATQAIQERYAAGESPAKIREAMIEGNVLQPWFSPEFLNRFDHIAVFTPLEPAELMQIAELLLQRLAHQLQDKGIQLRWTAAAVAELVQKGYHPQYGARPLRRVIQDQVQDALAQLLLEHAIARRDIVELQSGGHLKVYPAEKI